MFNDFHKEILMAVSVSLEATSKVPGTNGPLWLMSFAGPEVRYAINVKSHTSFSQFSSVIFLTYLTHGIDIQHCWWIQNDT